MTLTEEFNKLNDYTLRVDLQYSDYLRDGVQKVTSCTTVFNFLKRQQTTIHRDWLSEGRASGAAGTSAISTHVINESFDELPSLGEVRLMHRKLVELGGKPPSIDEVLGIINKSRKSGLESN